MTDERAGAALWTALRRVPPGTGVVFRHHATPPAERRALFKRVRRIARARRLVLVVAGGTLPGADGVHGRPQHGAQRRAQGGSLRTWPAHDRRQALAGVRAGASLLFVSPLYATRSHPGARPLGPARAARIGAGLGVDVIALGGMNERRWWRIRRWGFDGWAAIDAWARPDPR